MSNDNNYGVGVASVDRRGKRKENMTSKRFAAALVTTIALGFTGLRPATAADDLLKTIKDRGTMRVCQVEYVPWSVKNPITNTWEGINPEIIEIIARDFLKVKVENVDANFGSAIPNMNAQKCDMIGAPFYISAPRAELVSFTRPFATDATIAFVTGDSADKSIEDIDKPGKTVVVRSGSFEEPIAKRIFKSATVKSLTADGGSIQLLEIGAGRGDAALGSLYGNLAFMKKNPNLKVKALPDVVLARMSIAYAVPPKEYFFRDYLNASISSLDENGQIKAIIDKWFK